MISPINQKLIRVNSEYATAQLLNGYTTNFTYDFENIQAPENYTMALRLESFYCPYSFYGINEYNCYLDIQELNTVTNATRNRTIQLPYGNYAMRDFAIQLTTQLNVLGDIVYLFIINKNQNTFSISVNAGWNSTFLFLTGANKARSCHNQLGFIDNADYLINDTIHSNKMVMLFDILSLSLKLDLVNNIVVSKDNVDNILTTLPINVPPFGIITYQNADDSRRFLLSQKYINMFTVSLVDNNNNPIQLNGKHFFFTLQIDFIPCQRYGLPMEVDARASFNRLQYSTASFVDGDRQSWDPKQIDKMIKESVEEEMKKSTT